MSESESIKVNISSRATHRGPAKSTTLNRHYVKRPTISHITINDAPKTTIKPKKTYVDTPDLPPARNPYERSMKARRIAKPTVNVSAMSARALKDAEINRALRSMKAATAAKTHSTDIPKSVLAFVAEKEIDTTSTKKTKKLGRGRRIAVALACSAAVILVLGFLVRINMPDVSVKVAAMQTGIDASYPNYVPRDFSLTGVYTDKDTIVIDFTGPDNQKFSLGEEKSSWDSAALLNNYVKQNYSTDYSTIREGGITIYVDGSNATWVNGGMRYLITAEDGILTKKQIKNIVTSL